MDDSQRPLLDLDKSMISLNNRDKHQVQGHIHFHLHSGNLIKGINLTQIVMAYNHPVFLEKQLQLPS